MCPLHPLIGAGNVFAVRRAEAAAAIGAGEIADDGVAFPEDEAAVVHHRDEAIGVHGAVFGRVVAAERAARVDALTHDADFVDGPHDLLDVDGGLAAPDFKGHDRRLQTKKRPAATLAGGR